MHPMAEKRESSTKKRLVFHLRGGTQGPHQVRSDQSGDNFNAAQKLWVITMNGVIGRRFDWYEPDGTQRRYQVVGKNEAADEIVVTCECVSESPKPVARNHD
jgi:hypothetical protein